MPLPITGKSPPFSFKFYVLLLRACCVLYITPPPPPPLPPLPRDPQQRKGTPLGFLFVCFVGANDAGAASGGHLTFGRFASFGAISQNPCLVNLDRHVPDKSTDVRAPLSCFQNMRRMAAIPEPRTTMIFLRWKIGGIFMSWSCCRETRALKGQCGTQTSLLKIMQFLNDFESQ